jgi:hypothetical protein
MQSVDVYAVFPLSTEETWGFLFGDQLRHIVKFSPAVAAVEDYVRHPDGTPLYAWPTNSAGSASEAPPTISSTNARSVPPNAFSASQWMAHSTWRSHPF